jgi:hypothetical protein
VKPNMCSGTEGIFRVSPSAHILNSSPSQARFNPNEPVLQLNFREFLKASPLRIGVEIETFGIQAFFYGFFL